ncbi:MAG TPA: abortive infection system antitoxin AbiGi family protein, partial [Flavobacteriales bacterium]|nr:abortive infection system antitoxin AbiGi family protein [Flavobacteriales bacterium]
MSEIKRINQFENPDHINPFLTHWVGRKKSEEESFAILKTILENSELKFSACPISFPSSTYTVTQEMICFTDTPIRQSKDTCIRYGYFGMSFNKAKMIEHGANPVLYLTDNRSVHMEFELMNRYSKNEDQLIHSWITGIMQPFDTKKFAKDNHAEFYEREWRIVRKLPAQRNNVARKYQGEFNEHPFMGELRRQQNSQNINDETFFLKFNPAILENVIVPESYESEVLRLMETLNLNCEVLIIQKGA